MRHIDGFLIGNPYGIVNDSVFEGNIEIARDAVESDALGECVVSMPLEEAFGLLRYECDAVFDFVVEYGSGGVNEDDFAFRDVLTEVEAYPCNGTACPAAHDKRRHIPIQLPMDFRPGCLVMNPIIGEIIELIDEHGLLPPLAILLRLPPGPIDVMPWV